VVCCVGGGSDWGFFDIYFQKTMIKTIAVVPRYRVIVEVLDPMAVYAAILDGSLPSNVALIDVQAIRRYVTKNPEVFINGVKITIDN
jgi:hypothetical protein